MTMRYAFNGDARARVARRIRDYRPDAHALVAQVMAEPVAALYAYADLGASLEAALSELRGPVEWTPEGMRAALADLIDPDGGRRA